MMTQAESKKFSLSLKIVIPCAVAIVIACLGFVCLIKTRKKPVHSIWPFSLVAGFRYLKETTEETRNRSNGDGSVTEAEKLDPDVVVKEEKEQASDLEAVTREEKGSLRSSEFASSPTQEQVQGEDDEITRMHVAKPPT